MRTEQLSDVLGAFAHAIVTDFSIQDVLDHLVKQVVDVMPVTAAGVTVASPGVEPRYVAASDRFALRYEQLQSELREGPSLTTFQTGEATAVPDLIRDDRFGAFASQAVAVGLAAMFTFPLHHEAVMLGTLDLYRDRPGGLSEKSIAIAQTLADVAAAYLINARTRSDLQDSADQSRAAVLHDPLTGLPNRVLIRERLEHALLRGRRSGRTTAVFFLDLDSFTAINDTHGHRIGDELLIAIAERLTAVLRPGDSVARLSGDEFVVVCEDLGHLGDADEIAVRFARALAAPVVVAGVELTTAASIGIAFTGSGSDTAEELIHEANVAMHQAKRRRGRDHHGLDRRGQHLAEHRAGLARSLPGAGERNELHVEYQPIVNTADGRLTGVEALLRWSHPSRGPVAPTVFVPFAEQSGQIVELGRWVLERACADRQQWQRKRPDQLVMSVNVSSHQLMSAGFVDSVAAVLDATETDGAMLTLEVTERVLVGDEARAIIVLGHLKDISVKLALDDFGTGYSSLGYLDVLPIDTIKIDQTFVSKLTAEPERHTIVSSIIQLAHGLGMTAVAEGVETAQQRQMLIRLGADACQGFYFARAMSADAIDGLIADGPIRLPAGADENRL